MLRSSYGIQDAGDYRETESDSRNPGCFDDVRPSCYQMAYAIVGDNRATALIYVKQGG